MVPYFQLPTLRLLGMPIPSFTYLITLGMLLAFFLAQRRVRVLGLSPAFNAVAMLWVTLFAFLGAHLFEVLAYHPRRVLDNPFVLLQVWDGLASFGGFVGGTLALWVFCQRTGIWMLAYLDAQIFGYVPGWILARAACFVSHDHLGAVTTFFLAVAYPDGPRHNLGFYEMLCIIPITALLYLLPRKPRFVGFYTALTLLCYGPSRFLLDLLRTDDARYLGLTPAQYLCLAQVGLALLLIRRGRRPGSPMDGTEHLNG